MSLYRCRAMVLLLLCAASLASCNGQGASPSASPSASASAARVDVDVVRVRVGTVDDEISVVGNFTAITQANISPKAGGQVINVPVRLGEYVSQGALLIQLDTADIEAQLAQDRADVEAEITKLGRRGGDASGWRDADAPAVRKAHATMENARLQWERNRNLYRADLIAQKDLQDAKAQYLAAQADYQTALENVQTNKANVQLKRTQVGIDEQKLRNCTVRAPFAGYVASRNVNPGDYIQPGGQSGNNEYMKLVTIDPIYCTLDIPEMYSQRLRLGQPLQIKTVAWPDRIFRGRVTHLSPSLDPATRTLRVDATLANPEKLLKPGSYGNVKLLLGQTRNVRLVPQVAEVEQAGVVRVFIVEQQKDGAVARGVTITRGILQGAWIQVDAGLVTPSTDIIVTNLDKLYDGAPIKLGKTLPDAPPPPGSVDAQPSASPSARRAR